MENSRKTEAKKLSLDLCIRNLLGADGRQTGGMHRAHCWVKGWQGKRHKERG